uniref:Large ribosomal subunit protein uL29m n=1 Tax=Corethrella appendiculata TaxID=1370023 RepID=U5EIR2_9DIPT
MAFLNKIIRCSSPIIHFKILINKQIILRSSTPRTSQIHTTLQKNDLMEFFDKKENWAQTDVKHGREWKLDELRIKSNSDLHKLWFVLLKERNMLLTMEEECKRRTELFPSPERIDKIELSMKNLETVVRERNRAYFELETGETGERPGRLVKNQFGLNFFYRMCEHVIPQYMNKKWNEKRDFDRIAPYDRDVQSFLKFYREKLYNVRRKKGNRDRNEVVHILKRFPNVDRKYLAEKYPTVDIDILYKKDKIRSNSPIN